MRLRDRTQVGVLTQGQRGSSKVGYSLNSKLGTSVTGTDVRSGAIRPARWLPAVLAAAAVMAMAIGSVSSTLATSSTTITLASGVDSVSYAIAGGSWLPAKKVASPNPAWGGAVAPSHWINRTGNDSDEGNDHTTTYQTTFTLPALSAASIDVQVMADNAATVYLNDVQIGQQPQTSDPPDPANFQTLSHFTHAIAAHSSTPTDFVVGTNTLRIVNADYGVANGIDFVATITYSPPIPVTVSFATVTRPYDGTTDGSVATGCTLSGVEAGDTVTCDSTGASATFDSRNAGARTATGSGFALGGAQAWRYTISSASGSGTISQAPLEITAVPWVKTADGLPSADGAVPQITSGTVYLPDIANFLETFDTPAAGSGKTLTPDGSVDDHNNGDNYSYLFVPDSTGRIRPGPVDSLSFTAQPIDTKLGTPIYNFCTPGGSPCAGTSLPVTVTARDHWANLAGPGAPGALGEATISVLIKKDDSSGATIGPAGGTPTTNGVASFGGTLVNSGTFTGTMKLYAVTGTGAGLRSDLSSPFRIVDDLAPCRSSICKNNIGNGGNPKSTLQYLYGQIGTIGTGTDYSDTTLTTQFLSAHLIDGLCGNSNKTINMPVELRATGSDVASTKTGYMLVIIPRDTLKFDHVTSRGTPSFNVCLGALYLGGGQGVYGSNTATGWIAKKPSGTGTVVTQPTPVPDDSGYYRYWGTPANCGASGLNANGTDPCIYLRTKQKSDITALITQGILKAGADANMHDADLGIVIKKPNPWDGRGGVY